MSNNPFKATIERLLNDEIHFFARQSPPIQQLGALANEAQTLKLCTPKSSTCGQMQSVI